MINHDKPALKFQGRQAVPHTQARHLSWGFACTYIFRAMPSAGELWTAPQGQNNCFGGLPSTTKQTSEKLHHHFLVVGLPPCVIMYIINIFSGKMLNQGESTMPHVSDISWYIHGDERNPFHGNDSTCIWLLQSFHLRSRPVPAEVGPTKHR